uniref:Uncharacterized protein n=1 Tax=Zea mays TaxID=4577 RepID=A0A804N531_MAIZE
MRRSVRLAWRRTSCPLTIACSITIPRSAHSAFLACRRKPFHCSHLTFTLAAWRIAGAENCTRPAGGPKNARTRYDRKADWILTAAAAASPPRPPPRAFLLLVLLPDAGSATTVPEVDAASGTAAAAACCCPCSCCTTTTCSSASEKQCDDEDASGPWELDAAAPGRRKLHRLFSLPCGVAAACACEGSGADSTDWQSASALSLAFLPFLPDSNKFLSHWLALPICARRTTPRMKEQRPGGHSLLSGTGTGTALTSRLKIVPLPHTSAICPHCTGHVRVRKRKSSPQQLAPSILYPPPEMTASFNCMNTGMTHWLMIYETKGNNRSDRRQCPS